MATKKKTGDISYPDQKIIVSPLEDEMQTSYIDYAMSVIVGRALPDVRDGLKPVHRRILYAMYEDNITHEKLYKKSATTVGNVLGRYHPHGDASVYDALVRLAQDFSMRYMLVDGHGNFGSIDGDPPAAYRYTEARLSKIADEMLRDIDKETVDWDPNFDESRKEPKVLPSRFPNLLVNGSSGIAVGMTTNIPPHNLTEVIDGVICVLHNPEASLADIMEYIKGPDFPTKGVIMGMSGIRAAYATGRGKIIVRGKVETEEEKNGEINLVVTELPYQVNKKLLVMNIAEQVKDKRLEGIRNLTDESDKDGIRIVIGLKRDANPQVVLNKLYAQTALQSSFAVVMLALVDNQTQPRILNLRQVLDEYIKHQEEIIIRRTRYDLRKAEERAHILEGLRIACDNIDEIIRIIRSSYNNAKENLMERFNLSEIQAQSILEMQLRRLQGLEREKIEEEYQALLEKISYYKKLLTDEEMLKSVLIDELTEIRDKYGDERKTEIAPVEDEIDIEDLIEEEECVFTLTHNGSIKRLPSDTYKTQKRGGKGITALSTREEDFVETLFTASTHDYILFFTDSGRVYRKKGYQIPETGRTARGVNIVNFIQLTPGEKVETMLSFRDFDDDVYLTFVTANGTVKRMRADQLKNIRQTGIRAVTLDEGDTLITVLATKGDSNLLIATRNGKAICFNENDIRPMGREAVGIRGIKLKEGDRVIGAVVAESGKDILSVTENGYGKRTPMEEYIRGDSGEPQKRGGSGMKNYNITEKTGSIAQIQIVDDNDDIMIIADDGIMIRMAASDISVYGRSTQGVRVMKLREGVKVISAAKTAKLEEADAASQE